MTERFAFTIKDNRRECTDYQSTFDNWIKKGCIIHCKYPEMDSTNKLHFHGIVSIPSKVYRKALCPKGMHFLLKPIFDEDGWETYIKKEQDIDSDDTDDNDFFNRITHKLFPSRMCSPPSK